jgi:diguanylate cyclase (GGDEF)-like protein
LDREEEDLLWRVVEQVALVLDHVLLLEQIEHLETIDRLTGLVNHRRLLDLLDYEMQRHRFAGKRLALLLFDVEGLDGINRSYGRRYGNHILQKLAALIKETARPIDVIARSGLDEFAVMLPETDDEEAVQWLDTLRERLLTVEFAGGDVGLSAAVTHIKPGEMLTPESFLRRAEQALREAKRQQRDWTARLG